MNYDDKYVYNRCECDWLEFAQSLQQTCAVNAVRPSLTAIVLYQYYDFKHFKNHILCPNFAQIFTELSVHLMSLVIIVQYSPDGEY